MSRIAVPSPADRTGKIDNTFQDNAPWHLDPTLLPLLRAIVAGAAEAGSGAALMAVAATGEPHLLIGVRGNRYPWRALASTVLERGELVVGAGAVGAPVRGQHGLAGVLLLRYDATDLPPNLDHLMCAHVARVETALATSSTTLDTMHGAVDALVQALAAHDPETARHARLVRQLTLVLGEAAGLAPHALRELDWIALLHDVGKIGIAPRLLQKPGSLSAAEWALMRQHPATGERIVRAVPALGAIGRAIRHHHERWNGGGYPDRLSGTAIPLCARLVTLADAYETMRTGRPYQPPRCRDDTLAELRRGAGAQFDPTLVALLPALAEHDIDL